VTIVAGWVIDKIGTKLGLALSLITWSIFGIVNAFVGRLLLMHILVRSAFAIGEAGNFPASIKTVAEWFPKRERALATAVFNSGSNFGAMIAALFVPWCMIHFGDQYGWKMAFIFTGAIGFLWLIFWFWLYDTPHAQKRLSRAEYACPRPSTITSMWMTKRAWIHRTVTKPARFPGGDCFATGSCGPSSPENS
jgi:ACS family hexuronate transporter-like MFS transporter